MGAIEGLLFKRNGLKYLKPEFHLPSSLSSDVRDKNRFLIPYTRTSTTVHVSTLRINLSSHTIQNFLYLTGKC